MKLAQMGLYQRTIADWLNVSENTITNYKRVDEDFAEAFNTGPANARAIGLAKLLEKVGEGNIIAIKYYLSTICGLGENMKPDPLTTGEHAKNVVNLTMPDNGRRNDIYRIEATTGTADSVPSDEG